MLTRARNRLVQFALALFEGDCLRWLGQLLGQGATLLRQARHGMTVGNLQEEVQLLWLFQAKHLRFPSPTSPSLLSWCAIS